MRKAVDRLWESGRVTGEILVRPLEGNRWRLEVHAEQAVGDQTIDSLGGKRVKAPSVATPI